MNEDRYQNPHVFNPDRYLGDDLPAGESAALMDATKRDHSTFGSGRRICQGIHIAERSLFLAISRFLWSFDFRKARGPDGGEMDVVPHRFSISTVLELDPFQCEIAPRDGQRVRVIGSAWEGAKKQFQSMGLEYKE